MCEECLRLCRKYCFWWSRTGCIWLSRCSAKKLFSVSINSSRRMIDKKRCQRNKQSIESIIYIEKIVICSIAYINILLRFVWTGCNWATHKTFVHHSMIDFNWANYDRTNPKPLVNTAPFTFFYVRYLPIHFITLYLCKKRNNIGLLTCGTLSVHSHIFSTFVHTNWLHIKYTILVNSIGLFN